MLPPVPVDPETLALLQAGKLEQACPACGLKEAAGEYCSLCLTPTGEPHWFKPIATAAQTRALDAARAKRHATAENGVALEKTAKTGTVA